MVDTTLVLGALGLIATISLIVLTWLLLPDSPSFAITARRHWVRVLRRRSRDFGLFMSYLRSGGLGRMDPRLQTIDWVVSGAKGATILVLVLGSLVGLVPVLFWDIGIIVMIAAMFFPRLVAEFLTKNPKRLEGLSGKVNPSDWDARDYRLAIVLLLTSDNTETSAVLAVASPVGVLISFAYHPYDPIQQIAGAAYLVLALFLAMYWSWFLLATERLIESRTYQAFVRDRIGFKVRVDVYYAGNGKVVENGELQGIEEDLRVKDGSGGWYEMSWRRVDLIVPHDPPPEGPESWRGVA